MVAKNLLRNQTADRRLKLHPGMKFASRIPILPRLALGLLLAGFLHISHAGITLITHGLNSSVDGWVTGMASRIPQYPGFFGTNYSIYQMGFSNFAGNYYLTAARTAGSPASNPESGEIIIKLDWRDLDDGNSYDTFQVASAVTPALLSTNFIPELGGRAIAAFPLHLIGHSRGGSMVCELSRQLGTNGVWVDHVTTLDPHPLNDPAFPFDWILYRANDAPANTYVNVLFADNYWQSVDSPINGKSVAGAFVRKLTTLGGGYSSAHSDVHLWYHGTLDWRIPASDTETNLTSAERATWWFGPEAAGTNAGFRYSLIGRGDRTSSEQPVGLGLIRDGFNQNWDLGAGTSANRTALPTNNGAWPNLLRLNRTTTNQVAVGESLPVKFYYQWAKASSNLATIRLYLDDDFNPLNTNQTLLSEIAVPGNGAGFVSVAITNLLLSAASATPGAHTILGTINGGGNTRYLYAPETVTVVASRQPPTLEIARLNTTQFRIGVLGLTGQTLVLESSTDLLAWTALATNTLATGRWDYTNTPAPGLEANYYRAVLP